MSGVLTSTFANMLYLDLRFLRLTQAEPQLQLLLGLLSIPILVAYALDCESQYSLNMGIILFWRACIDY
jgi:hypothetical protein